jgi:hypothetical protein
MIRFRLLFLVMAAITILVMLAPLVLGFASAVFTYHGKCFGFTDGSWSCAWQEYVTDQVFWAFMLDIPLSLYLIPCWLVALGLWLHQRRTVTPQDLPFSLVAVIPMGGCLGGACLISIFPVFLRLFYGFVR